MTSSPLLPPGRAGLAAEHLTETEATSAELGRMTELALGRGARSVALGRGNSPAAARAADGFARRWETAGGTITCTITWPETAASWLRQATRFAAADPDLWVMAGPATGWAQMTRRLLWSTPWRPERTLAFAALGTREVISLVGAHNLPGLTGPTATGGTWHVTDGLLRLPRHSTQPRRCDSDVAARTRQLNNLMARSESACSFQGPGIAGSR